jgi:hypothetical protein
MRRGLGFALFTAGCLSIFISPLLRFYATPRVEKAPFDVYETTTSSGTGSYFSVKTLSVVGPTRIRNVSVAKGDPVRSTQTVAVIGLFTRTRDLARGDFDFGYSVYAFNRTTGYGVACCGAKPVARGLTLKFPFHTNATTYPFWDSTARRPFPARFARTEAIESLLADVFVSRVPTTRIGSMQVPGGIVGMPGIKAVSATRYYSATTTLWVEPFTGAILKASQHSRQWFADPSDRPLLDLADIDVTTDSASVRSVVDRVSPKLRELRLVSQWLPIGGPPIGILALIGALLLLRSVDLDGSSEADVVGAPTEAGVSRVGTEDG